MYEARSGYARSIPKRVASKTQKNAQQHGSCLKLLQHLYYCCPHTINAACVQQAHAIKKLHVASSGSPSLPSGWSGTCGAAAPAVALVGDRAGASSSVVSLGRLRVRCSRPVVLLPHPASVAAEHDDRWRSHHSPPPPCSLQRALPPRCRPRTAVSASRDDTHMGNVARTTDTDNVLSVRCDTRSKQASSASEQGRHPTRVRGLGRKVCAPTLSYCSGSGRRRPPPQPPPQ